MSFFMKQYYISSWAFNLWRVLLAGLLTLLASIPLVVIYNILIIYIPAPLVNILTTVGFWAALWALINLLFKHMKVRNITISYILAWIVAILAHYLGWIVRVAYQYSPWYIPEVWPFSWIIFELFNPATLLYYIQDINLTWTRSYENSDVKWIALWFIRWVEALLVIIMAIILQSQAKEPFCEESEERMTRKNLSDRYLYLDPKQKKDYVVQRESGDFSTLVPLSLSDDDIDYTKVSLYHNESKTQYYISITSSILVDTKKNTRKAFPLIKHLSISPEKVKEIFGTSRESEE